LKFAFFSDIHGNLPALEIAIKESSQVDGYYILGDVVNYGPWSNECVQLIDTLPVCNKILGNHEEFFIEGKCDSQNYLAREFFNRCYPEFNSVSLIESYKRESQFENYTCIHTLENKYIFKDTNININKNYIIGHSHQQYEKYYNNYKIINPGSVGQNRHFINEINFLIYDTKHKHTDFRSSLYNVDIVINEMEKRGYPEICVDYYRNKKRR